MADPAAETVLLQLQRRLPPERTCVGCRERAAKSELLRVVTAGGEVIPDWRARRPGRGAYLHPRPACLDAAERRRALPRALHESGPLDVAPVRQYLLQGGAIPIQPEAGPDRR
ncbi:MAG: YlxR family protein [Mycobacteriales bacterium]